MPHKFFMRKLTGRPGATAIPSSFIHSMMSLGDIKALFSPKILNNEEGNPYEVAPLNSELFGVRKILY